MVFRAARRMSPSNTRPESCSSHARPYSSLESMVLSAVWRDPTDRSRQRRCRGFDRAKGRRDRLSPSAACPRAAAAASHSRNRPGYGLFRIHRVRVCAVSSMAHNSAPNVQPRRVDLQRSLAELPDESLRLGLVGVLPADRWPLGHVGLYEIGIRSGFQKQPDMALVAPNAALQRPRSFRSRTRYPGSLALRASPSAARCEMCCWLRSQDRWPNTA